MQETGEMLVWSLGQEDPEEQGMEIHSCESYGQRSLEGYGP